MLELAYMSIEGMTKQQRDILYTCISPCRREVLEERKNCLSADLSLAAEALARVMLWKAGKRLPGDYVIERDEYGKPYQATVPGLFFNCSHSGNMVACGIAGENIGVDIQKMTEGGRVREKLYTREEWDEESALDEKPRYFTEIWTKKESYLKLTGEGLRRELKTLNIPKMQAGGKVQWYGGWVLEDYCLYACAENDCIDETGYRICQISLAEVTTLIKRIQEN